MNDNRTTVGIEIVAHYEQRDINEILNKTTDELKKHIDFPRLAQPIQAGIEQYVSKISNAFSKANTALKQLGDETVNPTIVDGFSSELKLFKGLREDFRDFVKSPANSPNSVTAVTQTLQFLNEIQTKIISLGSKLQGVSQVMPDGSNYGQAAAAIKILDTAMYDFNRRVETFNKYMADPKISQGIIQPAGQASPSISSTQTIQLIDVTNNQINAIKENSKANQKAADTFMAALALQASSGPMQTSSELIQSQLAAIKAANADLLNKFVIVDFETGAHKTNTPVEPGTERVKEGLEMITSMAIKMGNTEASAFKVDYSQANYTTPFFAEHLAEQLEQLPLKDFSTEMHKLADEIRTLGLTFIGFNNKGFDNRIALENVKATGDTELIDKWSAIVKDSKDVREMLIPLFSNLLPRLTDNPDKDKFTLGTSLNGIRAALLQFNTAHVAKDDVDTTQNALILAQTAEGQKLFNDLMRNQGGLERWEGLVAALITDKYSYTKPVELLENPDDDTQHKAELLGLIKAAKGLGNLTEAGMTEQSIPGHIIDEILELQKAYAFGARLELQAYQDGIKASKEWVAQLHNQSAAGVQLVTQGVATIAAITGLAETLKSLQSAFIAQFKGGVKTDDLNRLTNPQNLKLNTETVGLDLDGFLNKFFLTLNSKLDRALNGKELANIFAHLKDVVNLTVDSLAQSIDTKYANPAITADDLSSQQVDAVMLTGKVLEDVESGDGTSIEGEYKKFEVKLIENASHIALLSTAFVQGLEKAVNNVLKGSNLGLNPVINATPFSVSELSASLKEGLKNQLIDQSIQSSVGHDTTKYTYPASMFHLLEADLAKLRLAITNKALNGEDLSIYGMTRQKRGNESETAVIELLNSEKFAAQMMKDTGLAFKLIDTQVRIAVGAFNYAIDALVLLGGKLTVLEIKDTDNVNKISEFMNNPASDSGKQWLNQGLMYREWVAQLTGQNVELYFVLISMAKDAVKVTGDAIVALKQIDGAYTADVKRITQQIIAESKNAGKTNISAATLTPSFEKSELGSLIESKMSKAAQTAAMISISAGLVADDVIRFAALVQTSLKTNGHDLEKLYIKIHSALNNNIPTELTTAASKFFAIGNFAEAFDKLINLINTFDAAKAPTEKLQVILSSYRSGVVPDGKFGAFTEAAVAKINALTGYQKALAEISSNFTKANTGDVATLQSLVSTLTATTSGGISPEVEYIKTLEVMVEPLRQLLNSARKMASKNGEVLPPVIDAMARYIDDLEKMQKEIPSKLTSARSAIAVLLQEGDNVEALKRAQESLKTSFANQIAYLKALENFNKKGFGEAEQALRTFALPTGTSAEASSAFITQVNKLAKAVAEGIFSPDLVGQLISVFKKTILDTQTSLPKISFADVAQKAVDFNPGTGDEAVKAQVKLLSGLQAIGLQLQTQAELNIQRDMLLKAETTLDTELLAIEQNIQKTKADQLVAQRAVQQLIERQTVLTGSPEGLDVSKAVAAALAAASDMVTKLAQNIFSPDLFKQVIGAYRTALNAGMASLPGVSFSDIAQQGMGLYQENGQEKNLSSTIAQLQEIQGLLDQQAEKNLTIEQTILRQTTDLEAQAAVEQRLESLTKARLDTSAGLNRILEQQAGFQARLASGGGGGSVPPSGNLPVAFTGDSKPVGGVNWDELSKQYTKSIASITMQTGLYGESLDLLRGKSSAADTELKRIIGLLGTHIGNKFLTEEEIGFKKLSAEIQNTTALLDHYQKMAGSQATKAEDLKMQAAAIQATGGEKVVVENLLIDSNRASLLSSKYKEEYAKLREQLANSAAEDTLKTMKTELEKIFSGSIDFGSAATLEQAQEKVRASVRTAQENLMQKAVDNFAKMLESTFTQETLTNQLKINTAAFKTGTTSMPQGNPSDLLALLNKVDLGTLKTQTGEMFDTANMKAALEALIGMDASMKSLTTGSIEADNVIKRIVADASKLITASAGTGSSSELAKGFLAAEQAVQKTVAEAKNLEGVYKNLQEQLATIDKALNAGTVTEGELTTLARERLKVEKALEVALAEQAKLAERVKVEILATAAAGKTMSTDYRSELAMNEAKLAGLKKLQAAEEELVKRKVQLQGEYQAILDQGLKADKKLVEDMLKINEQLAKVGGAPVGMTNQELKTATKVQDTQTANTKFATDIIDFAVWQVEWAAAANIVQGFFGAIQEGITTVIEFEAVLHKMAVISQASALETKQLGVQMLEISKVSPYSVKELGEGLIVLGQAGFNATEAMALLPSVTNLATASLETLKVAADIVTTAIEAYQLKLSDGAKVADVMNATAIESKLDLAQVGTAFNYVASTAATAGISVADTTTALGLMSNAGLKASTAGTALRSTLGAMMSPTAAFATQLAKVGLTAEDVNPRFHSLGDILSKMRDSGFNVENAFAGLDKRMAAGLITLVNQSDQWVTFKDKIENGTTAAEQAEKQMYTFENSTKALTHSFQALAIGTGESVLTPMALLARALQVVVDAITSVMHAIPESIKEFALLAAGTGIVISALNALKLGFSSVKAASGALNFVGPLAAGSEAANAASAALSGTTKTVAGLSDKLKSLSAIFLNPTMWVWAAVATGTIMAGKMVIDQVSGQAELKSITNQVNSVEGQLKIVKALTADLQKYNPDAAVNKDIQSRLKLEGFDIDVSKLDIWITNMSSMFLKLTEMQQQAELATKTNAWAAVKVWFKDFLNSDAEKEAAASAASSGVKLLKTKNSYFDDKMFNKALDSADFGEGEIGSKAKAEIRNSRALAIEEDPDWINKQVQEQQARIKDTLDMLKQDSIASTLKTGFDINLGGAGPNTEKKNKVEIARLSDFLRSSGVTDTDDAAAALMIYTEVVKNNNTKILEMAEAKKAADNAELELQLIVDAQDFADKGGKVTSSSAAFALLSKTVLAKVNDFAKLKSDLAIKQEELDWLLAEGSGPKQEAAIARATAEVALLMQKIEQGASAQVAGLVKFFETKLVNELGSQMQKMVKGVAPLAFVNDAALSADAGGVSLQNQEDYYSKLWTIQDKALKMKNSVSDSMRLEIGAKDIANTVNGNKSIVEDIQIVANPKRIDALKLERAIDDGAAEIQAYTEARGETIIEQKIVLWSKLRMQDATDEAQTASAAAAKKYFDIAQKAADEVVANKTLDLNFGLSTRSFARQLDTELGLAAKSLNNYSQTQLNFVETSTGVFNNFTVPNFSEAQSSILKLGNTFDAAQDTITTQYAAYQMKMAALQAKEKDALAFLDASSITKSLDENSLYQRNKTEILKAGAVARSEAMRTEAAALQASIQTELTAYNGLITKINEARSAGMESYNSLMQVANSIMPAAAHTVDEIAMQVQKLGLEATQAASRGDKATTSMLNQAISSLISSGGEATKGSLVLNQMIRNFALEERDNFEIFRSKIESQRLTSKDVIAQHVSAQQNLVKEISNSPVYKSEFKIVNMPDGSALIKEVFNPMLSGTIGAIQQVEALTTKQVDYAVGRTKQELEAIVSVPDTIAQANLIAQNNLIQLGITFKTVGEQATILGEKFNAAAKAANIAVNSDGTPTSTKGMVASGEIKLNINFTGDAPKDFNFSQANMDKLTEAVTISLTRGLRE